MLKRIFSFVLIFLLITPYTVLGQGISAKAYVVLDSATNTVLSEREAHKELSMASTTKIMTCLIACESGKLTKTVTVTPDMLDKTEGTLINLKVGNKITLLDLVYGAMLASGNDAANSIAVFLAGSTDAFVKLMNERAYEIGMNSTTFVTPSGLDSNDHHSTAYDMALLSSEASKNETLTSISVLQSAEITIDSKVHTVYNHNKLLKRDSSFIGLKTGYTTKAGRCLVSIYNYKGSKIICVTLNAPNDWEDHIYLIENAKKKYSLISKNEKVNVRTISEESDILECSYSYVVSSVGSVWVKIYYYPIIYVPVKKGDVIGYAEIYSSSTLLCRTDLLSNEDKG